MFFVILNNSIFAVNNLVIVMRKILTYINSNFLLKNILMLLCFGLVGVYIVSLLLNLFTRHGQRHTVPTFVGMTVDEASASAKDGELQLIIIDSLFIPKQSPGTIIDQSPKEGTGVKSGRKIFVTINAYRPKMEFIPYVTGLSLRQAKNQLETNGFEIEQLIYRNDIATNNVLGQSFNNKEISQGSKIKAELGSGITLVVGREQEQPLPVLPKVVGLNLRQAKSRLLERGFNIGTIKFDSDVTDENTAKVYKQSPSQEARNDYGARTSIWLTNDSEKISKSSAEADKNARKEAKIEEMSDSDEARMLKEMGL